VLNHQNNAKRLSLLSNAAKNFDILVVSLSVLHNYNYS